MHEMAEQQAVFRWIREHMTVYPELNTAYHIPNEGKRSTIEGANQIRQGLQAGMPVICLPIARMGWNSLYLEMKAGKNKVTTEQQAKIMLLRRWNNLALVARGSDEACYLLEEYLTGKMDVKALIAKPLDAIQRREDYYIGFCGVDCRQCDSKNCIGRKQ